MTRDEALALIKKALDALDPALSESVNESTDLIEEKIIDSLDSMNFLYELETLLSGKIAAIDDDYDDFRVESLIQLMVSN